MILSDSGMFSVNKWLLLLFAAIRAKVPGKLQRFPAVDTFLLQLCMAIRAKDPLFLDIMPAARTFFGDPDLAKNSFFLDSILIFLFKCFLRPNEEINEYARQKQNDHE